MGNKLTLSLRGSKPSNQKKRGPKFQNKTPRAPRVAERNTRRRIHNGTRNRVVFPNGTARVVRR